MQKLLHITAAIIMVTTAHAQKPDTARLLVHYKFTHVRDTANRAHPFTNDMVLLVGKTASVYKSYNGLVQERAFAKQLADAINNSPDGNIRINRRSTAPGIEYYQFANEQKLYNTQGLSPMNSYLMEEPFAVMDWQISGDTAGFGGLLCQKATTRYRGRYYTAWFCPGLPVHTGPWKLNGLPGLILEAYDAKREVVFAFNGIEKTSAATGVNLIKLPADATKTTVADFERLKQLSQTDPAAFSHALSAQAAGPDGNGPQMDIRLSLDPEPNNPIELTKDL